MTDIDEREQMLAKALWCCGQYPLETKHYHNAAYHIIEAARIIARSELASASAGGGEDGIGPLGGEFAAVWDANVDKLYERGDDAPAHAAPEAGGEDDLHWQLLGRARFLRDRKEEKSPHLLEEAARALRAAQARIAELEDEIIRRRDAAALLALTPTEEER